MILPRLISVHIFNIDAHKMNVKFQKKNVSGRGRIMKNLPEKQAKGSWVQTEREAHEAWARLIRKSPKAAELMHLITARIGENNAVVMSIPTIMKLMATSRPTVVRAIGLLREDRWIETVQIGGSGTTNAYVVNDRVAWTGPRDGIRFSLFSAAVIATDDEQIDRDKLGRQEPLRRLPQIGELQIPHGDGLPPPSQPFLDSMEPELPASHGPDEDEPMVRVVKQKLFNLPATVSDQMGQPGFNPEDHATGVTVIYEYVPESQAAGRERA